MTSALGFTEAVEQCKVGSFDLCIIGHSIPHPDKRELIHVFAEHCAELSNPVYGMGENSKMQVQEL